MKPGQWCAVIPAAGKGTRLKSDRPKLFTEVLPDITIWDVLYRTLSPVVGHIHLVLSQEGAAFFEKNTDHANVSYSIQTSPLGMGDAIFQGLETWSQYDNILIIWGDQVHVSAETLQRCITTHDASNGPRCTLPLVHMDAPYVEYIFEKGKLTRILQSREGDMCHPGGLADVGVFLLSTAGLAPLWEQYLAVKTKGTLTGEINFLPFMIFLSQQGWQFNRVEVADPDEARGINTPEDLAFFNMLYSANKPL